MMQLQIFKYEDENQLDNLTTVKIDGEIWFFANEVCKLLDIKNPSDAVSRLDDDEKKLLDIKNPSDAVSRLDDDKKLTSVILSAGQERFVNLVSESGLYALIFKSNKPNAKRFRKWVTKEVIPTIRKTGSYGINRLETPNFIIRFNDNWDRTDKGYFSVISELFIRLYGKFENAGYQIPNKAFDGKEIRPDNSVGQLFSKYLKQHHPDLSDKYKMYNHKFPNGMEFEARQYENELLPIFIKYIDDEWIPQRALGYFKDRDPVALDYLPKLLTKS